MGKHKNAGQDAILMRFMKSHREIAASLVTGDKEGTDQLWAELAEELNNHGPPSKDVHGWKKVWIDRKALVRKKIAQNRATGGGPYNKYALTAVEETIGEICGMFKEDPLHLPNKVEQLSTDDNSWNYEKLRFEDNLYASSVSSVDQQPVLPIKRKKLTKIMIKEPISNATESSNSPFFAKEQENEKEKEKEKEDELDIWGRCIVATLKNYPDKTAIRKFKAEVLLSLAKLENGAFDAM